MDKESGLSRTLRGLDIDWAALDQRIEKRNSEIQEDADNRGVTFTEAYRDREEREVQETLGWLAEVSPQRHAELEKRIRRLTETYSSSSAWELIVRTAQHVRMGVEAGGEKEAEYFGKTFYKMFPEDGPNWAAKKEGKLQRQLARAGAPETYLSATLGTLKPRKGTGLAELLAAASAYAAKIKKNVGDGVGLTVVGPVGAGKTTTAVAVERAAEEAGLVTHFVSASEMIDALKPDAEPLWFVGGVDDEPSAYINRVKGCDLLVLDDLGVERVTEFVREKLDQIISYRYDHKKATIITTNATSDGLLDAYSARLVDRLRERNLYFELSGSSYRKPAKDKEAE